MGTPHKNSHREGNLRKTDSILSLLPKQNDLGAEYVELGVEGKT